MVGRVSRWHRLGLYAVASLLVFAMSIAIPWRPVYAATDPAARWKFDETVAGTDAADYIGTNHGVAGPGVGNYPVPSTDTAPVNFDNPRSASFDGTQYYTINNPVSTDFTICAWVKTTSLGGGNAHYWSAPIMDSEWAGVDYDFGFGIGNGGRLMFGNGGTPVGGGGLYDSQVDGATVINDNQWHNVCVTRNNTDGAVKLYVDAQLDGSGYTGVGSLTKMSVARIGWGYDGAALFNGLIDDMRVYNVVLDETQLQNLTDGTDDPDGDPDQTPPIITNLSPADNATDVPTELDTLTITFNEPIVNGPPSGDLNKLVIRRASDNVAVYTMGAHETLVNISGNTAVFDVASVTGLEPGTAYYVQFGSGAFRDASGNYHAGIDDTTTWNFTTAGAPNAPGDDDDDGISSEEETGAPHEGDGNNDGHLDAEQSYVASFVDARTNKYITLAVDASCELSNVFANSESNHVAKDVGYSYASSFVNFTATGCDNGKSDVKLYYHGVAPGNVAVRKYNPNTKAYFTVSAATITAAPAPLSGTLVSYTVVDDGDLDIDKTPGVIVDPIGLGQLAVGAPNTGLGGRR